MKQSSGIYSIKSQANNKVYIGSAVNIMKRWLDHKRQLKKGVHPNKKMQNHVNKYGIDDLIFEIVEYCSKELLIPKEQQWLDRIIPKFNICKNAASTLGIRFKLSDKAKKTRSQSKKGKPRGYTVTIYKGAANVSAKKVIRTDAIENSKIYGSLSEVNGDGFIFQNVYRAIKKGYVHKGFVWKYYSTEGV